MTGNDTNATKSATKDERDEQKAQSSRLRGDSPATRGGEASSHVTEKADGKINPSAPGETGTTPGTNG